MGRFIGIVLGLVVLVAGGLGLLAFASGRDDAGVAADPAGGPGRLFDDRGSGHDGDAADVEADLAGVPLSGPHKAALPARDRVKLPADELLHALELGNVALFYGGARPPAALTRLQEEVAGAYDPEIAAAGQAVLLVPSDALEAGGSAAGAWRRGLESSDPAELRAFVDAWLGRGAG